MPNGVKQARMTLFKTTVIGERELKYKYSSHGWGVTAKE
jgi:hypothetical protein